MDNQGNWPVGALSAAGVALLMALFLIPWGDVPGDWWFGETGIVASVVAAVGIAGIVGNMYFARQTLRHSQQAEIATRYQKGVELLASAEVSVRIGGILILRDVANDAPKIYHNAVVAVLVRLIEEQCTPLADRIDTFLERIETEDFLDPPEVPTPADVRTALKVIGVQRRREDLAELEGDALKRNPLQLPLLVLSDGYFDNLNLSGFRLDRVVIKGAGIGACDFKGAIIEAFVLPKLAGEGSRVRPDVTFSDCDFTNAFVTLKGLGNFDTEPLIYECDLSDARLFLSRTVEPKIIDCNVDNFYLQTPANSDADIDLASNWYTRTEPTTAPARRPTQAFFVTLGAATQRTNRGMPKYARPRR